MDRSTQGSPAKYSFCFGENEEESPWEPYHVRKGFAATDSVVTTMAAEPPHNINDHSSNSGEGLVVTIAGTACQAGSNNVYLQGPSFFVLGPEHAQTLHRDGWTPKSLQEAIYERSKIHVSRISKENQERWAQMDRPPVKDHYYLMGSPDDAHIVVAGGPGKHSAFIPSFGNTAAPSVRVARWPTVVRGWQAPVSLFGDWPVIADEAASFEQAQAMLEEAGLSDGLPLVPPTRARLDAMLARTAASRQCSHGQLPPLFGEITAAAVGYNCVLAGCRPAELPVVLTAAVACLEPQFNALGLLTTTGSAAVATLVHGPIAASLGINGSTNCLGPGNRANASIGRAISLVLRNIGGARENVGDMATMGQPGKYTFCFAEADDETYPPLHVRRGLARDQSAVTVLGVSGTAEILPHGRGETVAEILDPIALAMTASVATYTSAERTKGPSRSCCCRPRSPIGWRGLGSIIAAIQAELFARGQAIPRPAGAPSTPMARSAADIHPIVAGGPGQKIAYLPLWGGGSFTVTPANRGPVKRTK